LLYTIGYPEVPRLTSMSYCYEYPHPAVTTDIVVFTIIEDELSVLLIERARSPYRGAWALPGGFVNPDENLEECARRELEEETGLADVFMEQLHTFGEPERDPRERVITVAYYALIPSNRPETRAASDAAAVDWFAVTELPDLAFDHADILGMAHARLTAQLNDSTIAFRLLPERFTLSELQRAYEVILGEVIDKRNFRKRVLGQRLIEETGEERRDGAHRPARLYRVIDRNGIKAIK